MDRTFTIVDFFEQTWLGGLEQLLQLYLLLYIKIEFFFIRYVVHIVSFWLLNDNYVFSIKCLVFIRRAWK